MVNNDAVDGVERQRLTIWCFDCIESAMMTVLTRNCWLGIALIATSLVLACSGKAAQEGEEGKLEFFYEPADGDRDFDRPLAVGSGMSIFVEALGSHELDRIRKVSTDPESVLFAELDDDAEDEVYIWGDAAGEATLEVEVLGGGEIYTDRVTLRVDEVDTVEMAHECTDGIDAAYMIDEDFRIPFERENADGEKLVGEVHSDMDAKLSCQVLMQPEYFQDRAYCNEAGLHFWAIDTLGPVYLDLIPEVSAASRALDELDIHIVDEDDIGFEPADGELRTDATRSVDMFPVQANTGGRPVCSHLDLYIEILTPGTCTARNGDLYLYIDGDDENEIPLRGQAPGLCEFAVEFADRPDLGAWYFDAIVRE